MKKTKAAYETYLNELFQKSDEEQLKEEFIYLTTKNRAGGVITKTRLELSISLGSVGSLIRWYDPIRFEVGFNDWKR